MVLEGEVSFGTWYRRPIHSRTVSAQAARHLPEPMRDAVRDHDHVTGRDDTRLDGGAADLVGLRRLGADGLSARHQGRVALQHVDDVGIARVDLDLAGAGAVAGVDLVAVHLVQRDALGEGGGDLLAREVRDGASLRGAEPGLSAAAAASASSSSCCALAAPETPTAPTICPSTVSGIPPWSGVKSLSATIAVRPLPMISSKARVGFLPTRASNLRGASVASRFWLGSSIMLRMLSNPEGASADARE